MFMTSKTTHTEETNDNVNTTNDLSLPITFKKKLKKKLFHYVFPTIPILKGSSKPATPPNSKHKKSNKA